MAKLLYEELSHSIIGAAMAVLYELKPGLDEKLYERALVLELQARGHRIESQKKFDVIYRGQMIGSLVPDLIIDEVVIADTKVVTAFTDAHIAQMIGYLAITNMKLAILLNFKFSQLQWKRVVREGLQRESD